MSARQEAGDEEQGGSARDLLPPSSPQLLRDSDAITHSHGNQLLLS